MMLADRLIELDIDALGGAGMPSRIDSVIARLLPLWRDAMATGGTSGLVLNLGWLMDPVMLFTGDPDQSLPIFSKRLAPYSRVSYAELGEMVASLRTAAHRSGIPELKVGMLILGIGEFVNEIVRAPDKAADDTRDGALYQERGEWYARHPELFPFGVDVTLHGPGVDWRVSLIADHHVYASRPHGVASGERFGDVLADQWAAVSAATGFDLLLLRDETTTPVHAGRVSFDGSHEPASTEEIDEWTDALIAVTSAIKTRSPDTMLVLYSSGLSPSVELRYGRLDIARVVARGRIDAWVDQTWGGAWQDWWDAGWQGWTFQLTNLLARAALIAEGNAQRDEPCRHYPLFQLLDGWEPYDTLHDYPDKLKWGIWAFSHASTRSATGHDTTPNGAYLAVANDRTGMLVAEQDVAWVAETLAEATASAANLDRTLGPLLVIPDRASAERASITAESVEDAAGFLAKWGTPALSAACSSMAIDNHVEGTIVAARSAAGVDGVSPRLIVGAPEDLAETIARHLGLVVLDALAPSGYRRGVTSAPMGGLKPSSWPYMGRRRATRVTSPGIVLYDGEDGPTAVHAHHSLWWLPPHVANGADRRLLHYQIGTVDPHIAVAWRLAGMRAEAGLLHLANPARHETISLHAWVSNGVTHILLGNVESGWIGDSRFARVAVVRLPDALIAGLSDPHLVMLDGTRIDIHNGEVRVDVPPEGLALGKLLGSRPVYIRPEKG